jgi:hypothetical protein
VIIKTKVMSKIPVMHTTGRTSEKDQSRVPSLPKAVSPNSLAKAPFLGSLKADEEQ